MSTCRKRKCSKDDEQGNDRTQSSYANMKLKMNNVQHELDQLRMELMETQQQKREIVAVLEMMRKEQQETNRNKRGGSKGGQSSYARLKMQLEDTQRMKLVGENELVKVRIDLVAVRNELQETQRREREFESVLHLLRTELQELTQKNEEHIQGMEDEMKGLKRAMGPYPGFFKSTFCKNFLLCDSRQHTRRDSQDTRQTAHQDARRLLHNMD